MGLYGLKVPFTFLMCGKHACAILRLMDNGQNWVAEVKARGWARAISLLLDAVEPLGALGAQVLYVAQPAMSVFGLGETIRGLASALETPQGIESLRAALESPDDNPPSEQDEQ